MAKGYILSEDDRDFLRQLMREQRQRPKNTQQRPGPGDEQGQTPDVYVAWTADGIPALTTATGSGTPEDDVPGSADCDVFRILEGSTDPYVEEVTGLFKTVYNLSTSAVPANSWVLIVRDKFGSWIAVPTAVGGEGSSDTNTRLTAIRVYEGNATWSKPTGLDYIVVEMVGGGGGGGSAEGATAYGKVGGGGGGGGGYVKMRIAATDLASTEAVVVGAGGVGDSGGLIGSTGGPSSFSGSPEAGGGGGGVGFKCDIFNGIRLQRGGDEGLTTGGDIQIFGQPGFPGISGFQAYSVAMGGAGGSSQLGHGGVVNADTAGDAQGYGGGGSGATNQTTLTKIDGGDGAAGVVIVYEYTTA